LSGIDVDRVIRSIPLQPISREALPRLWTHKEHRIRDLMLANPSAKHDHPGLLRMHAHIVQPAYIRHDIDIELS